MSSARAGGAPMPDAESPATATDPVRRHFDAVAKRFDAIYVEDKGWPQRIVDRLFRQVVHRRFELAMDLSGEVEGSRILDIGCGSGRYSVEMARRGAEVVGIDFAPRMLELAREAAMVAGVAGRCDFVNEDFLAWREPHHFHICLGIGFFDYVEKPGEYLGKVYGAGAPMGIFSFPARWNLRTPTRWLRLTLNRCPVYFYTESECRQLVAGAGWTKIDVHHLGRDFLVHGTE